MKKTFQLARNLIVFGALLIAVVGCGRSTDQRAAENISRAAAANAAADKIETFALAAEVSGVMLTRAQQFGKVSDDTGELKSAAEMETALRTGAVRKEDVRNYVTKYAGNMRQVIAAIREKIPEQNAWADQMEPLLAKLESAAK